MIVSMVQDVAAAGAYHLNNRDHADGVIGLNSILTSTAHFSQPVHILSHGSHWALSHHREFRSASSVGIVKEVKRPRRRADVHHITPLF